MDIYIFFFLDFEFCAVFHHQITFLTKKNKINYFKASRDSLLIYQFFFCFLNGRCLRHRRTFIRLSVVPH